MRITTLICTLFICATITGCAHTQRQQEAGTIAFSFDSVPISYSVYGDGDLTLVFVHGWSCDSRYWRQQVPYFTEKYQLVTIDLAGHGHSGANRTEYTMESFGKDVAAVVKQINAQKVILIGHSMGGSIISHAAQIIPDRVIGIIGVDTLHNVEWKYTQEEFDRFIKPFEDNFDKTLDSFVREMVPVHSDQRLVTWVVNDMHATNRRMALSALRYYIGEYVSDEAVSIAKKVPVPVRAINTDMWPTDIEANRRYYVSFDADIIEGAGHFLQLEQPDVFNQRLDRMISDIRKAQQ